MNGRLVKDGLGWGFALWLIGYALGMLLFAFVPTSLLGWIITPIGTALALWVAFRKVQGDTLSHYVLVALVWVTIAVIGDYLFIVKALQSRRTGSYKPRRLPVYTLTVVIPLLAEGRRTPHHVARLT